MTALGIGTEFQHTAARRRLANLNPKTREFWKFQHTAARRRLDGISSMGIKDLTVSTHSRPKAAGAFSKIGS